MRLFNNLGLTSKVVLLVALLGALSIIITLYSMTSLHTVDRDYRALLDQDAKASLMISAALLDLSDASRMVLSVLTEQDEGSMRVTQQLLDVKQKEFEAKLSSIAPLLKNADQRLEDIRQKEEQLFELAHAVIDSAARWRGDRALRIIHEEFDPALSAMRRDMDFLRNSAVDNFNNTSQELTLTTHRTLFNTTIAFTLALAVIIGLSAYISVTQISRPIKQLTNAMARLSRRDYDHSIDYTERRDEVGSMALALRVFRDSMQRADQLEREAIVDAENRRISQQLIDLTDAMPGAVFQLRVAVNGDQQFVFLSGKSERYVGPSLADKQHRGLRLDHIRINHSLEHLHELDLAIEHSLRNLQPLDIEMQVEHGNQRFWLKTLATARRTEDGATLFNGIWLDVSEAKAQAHALENAKEQAEQAAHAKAAFLATMSHEIRTPMNAILGLAQLILKHPLDTRQQNHMDKIIRSGHHLLGIINDILDFTKIDGGHLVAERIAFSPQQLLEDIHEMLEEKAQSKGLILTMKSETDLPVLMGDPLRISQILLNYTNNALKFSEHGTVTLRLSLQHEESGAPILYGEVEDQGIGMSEQEQEHLFLPFQQADTSITRRFGGTGLGLAISRSLAELMEGSVGVHSQPGRGSRFWFRVRVRLPDAEAVLPSALPVPLVAEPRLAGLRLLLVDDNELNREVAREFLQEAGIKLDEVEDGQQAIDVLKQAPTGTYDAVLMDMMMPGLDGLNATRMLRQETRFNKLPIIAMTANASKQDASQCRAAGMDAHIGKPIDQALLWQTLVQLCVDRTPVAEHPKDQSSRIVNDEPILDPMPLEKLRQLVSAERFASMLTMLVDDCLQRGRRFSELAGAIDLQTLRQEAHDLISTAGHAGLRRLEARARTLQHTLADVDSRDISQLCLRISDDVQASVYTLKKHFKISDG
ncbi:response regulator [Halopseudomonas salegens]|uniref:histidine kinase n=1 Tax=Halopseudomonas salegens TaxID=1434072 RepID=A0A1H2HEJ9_9GAMM|nr:response regulator [Halopseudomonas salegens]SDU30300.1 Signal transduction histidine kinase [Halopseudomonas salegens]